MQPVTLLLLASAASTAFGVTHNVQVAVDKTLTYTPNSINAAVGDQIEFDFLNGNHSVVQAAFATPCVPLANGFFSGFVPAAGSVNTFTITVSATDPVWFYCAQAKHCEAGMVGVINVNPNSNKTLAAFAAAAMNAPANVAPPTGPTGGVLGHTTFASNTTTNTTVGGGTSVSPPVPVVTTNAAVVPASVSHVGALLSLAMMAMGLLM